MQEKIASRMSIALAIVLGLVGNGFAQEAKDSDSQVPLGKWRQVAVVADGNHIEVGRSTILTVTPKGYHVTVDGNLYQKGTGKVDDDNPRQSEVTITEGANAGETRSQIAQVVGDVLVSCLAAPGAPRPTTFTSKPGSGHILSVWVRVE